MNITLSGKLLAIVAKKNQQTNEVRHQLSFLDTEGENPEIHNLKSPKDLDVTQLKKDADYVVRLQIWRMGDRFGFYIPGSDDIKLLPNQHQKTA